MLFKVVLQLCLLLLLNAIKIRNYLVLKKLLKILKHVFKTKVPVISILPKLS